MPAKSADMKWLEKAEHWGEWQRVPDDRAGGAESIWLLEGSSAWGLAGGAKQIDVGGSPAANGFEGSEVRDAVLPSPPETHPSLVTGSAV